MGVAGKPSPGGHWLAGGPYDETVLDLCASDPRLLRRDPKTHALRVPYTDSSVRVSVVEAQPDGAFLTTAQFTDSPSLASHLASIPTAKTPPLPAGRRAVYILEGLGPTFAGLLGSHFSLHPSFFVEHERVVVHDITRRGANDGVPLPSVMRARDHLRMRYHEVMAFDTAPGSFRWACGVTGKHIGVSRELKWDGSPDEGDRFLDVGMAVRKCGVWTRTNADGGWDCLVICDPPIRRVHAGETYSEAFDVEARPYQGGYLDFVPESAQLRARRGPPRTSLLSDLTFYLEAHSGLLDTSTPDCVSVLVQKTVASQYLTQIEHVRSALTAVQRGLTRKQDLARMPMRKVEALWSDMQAWERRTGEYLEDLEGIMIQLGIPLSDDPFPSSSATTLSPRRRRRRPQSRAVAGSGDGGDGGGGGDDDDDDDEDLRREAVWRDCTADFQFLLHRLRELRHRTASLNAAVTGLAGITGNRISYKEQQRTIREAKRMKAITLLGLVFVPLAYAASVFSMSGEYAPGGGLFWVYVAASVPLVAVVLTGYYVLDYGYGNGGWVAAWGRVRGGGRVGGGLGEEESQV